MSISVEITFNNIGKIAPDLRDEFFELQAETGEKVAELWSGDVRVDTGAYRDSITAEDGVAYSNVDHAKYNEYGTVHMSARPSARKAAEKARPEFENKARNLIRRTVARHGR